MMREAPASITVCFVELQKDMQNECVDLTSVATVPAGYIGTAEHVADRRMVIAGYRLADFLERAS